MTRRGVRIGYGLIVLFMLSPMIPAMLASLIAMVCGCQLNEAGTHLCLVFGKDIGPTLYMMFVLGWFGIATFPLGILGLGGFSLFVWWRRRAGDPDLNEPATPTSRATKHNWVLGLGLASFLCSILTAIPAFIVAAQSRPLNTRAKIGVTAAIVALVAELIIPVVL